MVLMLEMFNQEVNNIPIKELANQPTVNNPTRKKNPSKPLTATQTGQATTIYIERKSPLFTRSDVVA